MNEEKCGIQSISGKWLLSALEREYAFFKYKEWKGLSLQMFLL